MYILAIDTSCDDTSVAIAKNDALLANVVSSQIELHKKWGGVVPAIAKRAHEEMIGDVVAEVLKRSKVTLEQIDVFAVTIGPGLAIALEVGIGKIKELARKFQKPVVAVNHMEGHFLANFAKNSHSFPYSPLSQLSPLTLFPSLSLLISGGHTELVFAKKIGDYQKIGQTLDDAIGEAYDKVAKMLDLGYPGGPIIEELARQGDRNAYNLPVPMEKVAGLDFSYSGLKTAVLYSLKKISPDGHLTKEQIINLAASFERAAVLHLIQRTERAIRKSKVRSLIIGGGVTCNRYVRKELRQSAKKYQIPFIWPENKRLCTDNAGMIAVAAFYKAKRKEFVKDFDKLDRQPVLSL